MREEPRPFEQYRHFKGGVYQVLCVATREDTGEKIVAYQALYGEGRIWARDLEDFLSDVDRNKYPDVRQRYRFEKISQTASGRERDSIHGSPAEDSPEGRRIEGALSQEGSAADAVNDKEEDVSSGNLNPLLEQFLDARSADEKLTILAGMREVVTDDMIDTMAMASGVEIDPGPIETRYADLRDCLLMIDRYELERGRLRN